MPTTYTIKLASCPNPDHGETSAPKAPAKFSGTADEVAAFGEQYRQGLGGGNWKRADIYLGRKRVARMSYNGRLWGNDGSAIQQLPEDGRDMPNTDDTADAALAEQIARQVLGVRAPARESERDGWAIGQISDRIPDGIRSQRAVAILRLAKARLDRLSEDMRVLSRGGLTRATRQPQAQRV